MDRKSIVAFLLDAPYDTFMAYVDYGSLGVTVVGPDGKKHAFTVEQLKKAAVSAGFAESEIAIDLDRTIEEPIAEDGSKQAAEFLPGTVSEHHTKSQAKREVKQARKARKTPAPIANRQKPKAKP